MSEHEPPNLPNNVIQMDTFKQFRKQLAETSIDTGKDKDVGVEVDLPTFAIAKRSLEFLGEYTQNIDKAPVITMRTARQNSELYSIKKDNTKFFVIDPAVDTVDFLNECAEVSDPEAPYLRDRLTRFYATSLLAKELIGRAGVLEGDMVHSNPRVGEAEVDLRDDAVRYQRVNEWRAGSGIGILSMRSLGRHSDLRDCLEEGLENRMLMSQSRSNLAAALGRSAPPDEIINDEILGLANPLAGQELEKVLFTYRSNKNRFDQES